LYIGVKFPHGVADEVDGVSNAKGQLVSVIIPYYDRLELLPRALKSVVEQTYNNLEIIIVDDASHQDPTGVMATFDDARIVYVRHDTNQGVSGARNTGIDRAKGDLISFLDSDDEWLPTKVEKQLDALRAKGKEHQVCYCFSEVVSDETGKVVEVNAFRGEGDVIHPVLIGSGGSPGWTGLVILVNELMIAKEDLKRVGSFDERYRMHEDWELLIRLAQTYKFACVKEVLVRNHKHKLGHIGDRYEYIPEVRHLMFEAHKDIYAKDRAASSHFFAELAYYEGVNGMKGKALLSLFRSIANRPFRHEPYLKVLMLMTDRMQKPRTEW
jgi:glycosyltransferase involved in cell wall biosynthesis